MFKLPKRFISKKDLTIEKKRKSELNYCEKTKLKESNDYNVLNI